MKRIFYIIFLFAIPTLFQGLPSCTVSYSFTGAAKLPPGTTFSVYYFPNRAQLINPTLSQEFTEALREKLQKQTSMDELSENGDLEFEGQITQYDVRPMSIQKQDQAALNRLTIAVNVKYTNKLNPSESMEKTFSAFEDFDSSQSLSGVEDELVPEIIKKLNEDIFNATIANW